MSAGIEILLGLLLLLQLADYWTTMKVLSQGGHEDNPVVQSAMKRLGVRLGLALGKGVAVLAAVGVYWWQGPYTGAILGIACALYAVIVLRNYRQIK